MESILMITLLLPFLSGLLVYAAADPRRTAGAAPLGKWLAVFCGGAEFVLLSVLFAGQWTVGGDTAVSVSLDGICGLGMNCASDGFRGVYCLVAGFMWMMSAFLSGEYFEHHEHTARFYLFFFWTEGATLAVFLSADLFTTFLFFEMMSLTSYVWVAQEETKDALKAAGTYLAVAVIGGLVMLMGIFLLYVEFGTLHMDRLADLAADRTGSVTLWAAALCLLVGFGAKAGAFPLHIWLPKAHPVAPAPASALLSGILTKTGIYGILLISCRLFFRDERWGNLILCIGVLTMFGGALLAVFSIDLKRTLACSSMSQIGFILVGIGMQGLLGEENALAVRGTMLHMINHSLIKLVLFSIAGVIYMGAHALDLNKIRGYGRKKPLLAACFLAGALSIAGIPLFSGYVSKTLLHEAIVEYGSSLRTVEWIFLLSGGMTLCYMTKLFVSIFVERNEDAALQAAYDASGSFVTQRKETIGKGKKGKTRAKKVWYPCSAIAVVGSAAVLLVWGLVPGLTMDPVSDFTRNFFGLPEFGHQVRYFALENLKGAGISILIGMALYFGFVRTCLMGTSEQGGREYRNLWPKWMDLENLVYRPVLLRILPTLSAILCRAADSLVDTLVVLLRKTVYRDSPLPYELPEGDTFTHAVGMTMNRISDFVGIFRKNGGEHKNYVHVLALKREQLQENHKIIGRSLSFGLLLFGIGLGLTLLYLIWQ